MQLTEDVISTMRIIRDNISGSTFSYSEFLKHYLTSNYYYANTNTRVCHGRDAFRESDNTRLPSILCIEKVQHFQFSTYFGIIFLYLERLLKETCYCDKFISCSQK